MGQKILVVVHIIVAMVQDIVTFDEQNMPELQIIIKLMAQHYIVDMQEHFDRTFINLFAIQDLVNKHNQTNLLPLAPYLKVTLLN